MLAEKPSAAVNTPAYQRRAARAIIRARAPAEPINTMKAAMTSLMDMGRCSGRRSRKEKNEEYGAEKETAADKADDGGDLHGDDLLLRMVFSQRDGR